MKKHLIIILLVILILSSTGCIDTYLGKEILGGKVGKEKYNIVEKVQMSYTFETKPPNSENTKYGDSRNFSVKEETSWIHIKVEYKQPGLPNILNVYRHLNVTVFSPDGDEYNKTYEKTDEDVITIPPAIPLSSGKWGIEIESEGVGYPDYQDSFTVTVTAKEPI